LEDPVFRGGSATLNNVYNERAVANTGTVNISVP